MKKPTFIFPDCYTGPLSKLTFGRGPKGMMLYRTRENFFPSHLSASGFVIKSVTDEQTVEPTVTMHSNEPTRVIVFAKGRIRPIFVTISQLPLVPRLHKLDGFRFDLFVVLIRGFEILHDENVWGEFHLEMNRVIISSPKHLSSSHFSPKIIITSLSFAPKFEFKVDSHDYQLVSMQKNLLDSSKHSSYPIADDD